MPKKKKEKWSSSSGVYTNTTKFSTKEKPLVSLRALFYLGKKHGSGKIFFFFFFFEKKNPLLPKKKKKKRFLGEKKKEKRFENPGKILKKS